MTKKRGLISQPAQPTGSFRVVYVSDQPFTTDDIDVISPKAFNAILEQGWAISSQEIRKVRTPKGVVLTVDYVTLVQTPPTRAVSQRHARDMSDYEEPSRALATPQSRGLTRSNSSYLGDGSDFEGMPGVDLHTSRTMDNAFGMGVDCAKTGGTSDMNPFGRDPKLAEQWTRGFCQAGGADDIRADKESGPEAYRMGKVAGAGPPNVEVSCPYPQGSFLYKEWLRGFKAGGGEHIEESDSGMV